MLTRYNRKTVTVITDDGQHWNVAPQFLRKVAVSEGEESGSAKIIRLKPERARCRLTFRSTRTLLT
jgi:hypothetical protein